MFLKNCLQKRFTIKFLYHLLEVKFIHIKIINSEKDALLHLLKILLEIITIEINLTKKSQILMILNNL